jgi:hypothetical protein
MFAGPKMNPRDTSGWNKTFPDSQNHKTWAASNSRRPFFRSLLGA